MKFIITESLYKLITEDRVQTYQYLLNNVLKNIILDCNNPHSDNWPDDLSYDSCDEAEQISKITIVDFKWETQDYIHYKWKVGSKILVLNVDVYIDAIIRYEPNTLLFDIAKRMTDWLGLQVGIDLNSVHLINEPNW